MGLTPCQLLIKIKSRQLQNHKQIQHLKLTTFWVALMPVVYVGGTGQSGKALSQVAATAIYDFHV